MCFGDAPSIPDPNQAAIAGATADVQNYPFEYIINALSQMGGKATIGGKDYDFTGLGNADTNKVMSDQMAQALLDIQKNYGAQYIQQRLADLKQADPTGYAARQELFDRIMADANANPDRPLAQDTQNNILSELQQGGNLSPRELEQVQQGVRGQQIGRGVYLGNAATAQEGSAVVKAGEAAQGQRQADAANFLNAGVSPDDVQYRRIQQSLSDLGAFLNNQTPTAQFGSLSGAQNGAAPFNPAGYNPYQLNPNAAAQGVNNAFDLYSAESGWANSQVNPWTAGLNLGSNLYKTAAGLGFNPWTPSSTSPVASGWGGTVQGPNQGTGEGW